MLLWSFIRPHLPPLYVNRSDFPVNVRGVIYKRRTNYAQHSRPPLQSPLFVFEIPRSLRETAFFVEAVRGFAAYARTHTPVRAGVSRYGIRIDWIFRNVCRIWRLCDSRILTLPHRKYYVHRKVESSLFVKHPTKGTSPQCQEKSIVGKM